MKTTRIAAVVFLLLVQALPALAITVHAPVWSATYVAAMQPTFGTQGVPLSGIMKLNFNHGIVSGTYDSTSVRPDPMRGRIVNVSGNVSKGQIMLIFHGPGTFTVRGTLDEDATISGTTTIGGTFHSFLAKVKSSP
ncbi:MAG: hypothetical protein WA814_09395 [Candidatus Baltobacteraceae bacterium]